MVPAPPGLSENQAKSYSASPKKLRKTETVLIHISMMPLRFGMLLGSCLENSEQTRRQEQHQPPIQIQHLSSKETPDQTSYMMLVCVPFSL